MYFNDNKTMNLLIVAIISLIVIITLLVFIKTAKKPHPFSGGADIHDTCTPCDQ